MMMRKIIAVVVGMCILGVVGCVPGKGMLGELVVRGKETRLVKEEPSFLWSKELDFGISDVESQANAVACYGEEGFVVLRSSSGDVIEKVSYPKDLVKELKGLPVKFVKEKEMGLLVGKDSLKAMDLSTGRILWENREVRTRGIGGRWIKVIKEGEGILLYVQDLTSFHVYALDTKRGNLLWKKEIKGNIREMLYEGDENMLVICARKVKIIGFGGNEKVMVYGIEASTGNMKWEVETKNESFTVVPMLYEGMLAKIEDGMLIVYSNGIEVIDLKRGSTIWSHRFKTVEKKYYDVVSEPLLTEDRVYIAAVGKLYGFDKRTGKLLFESKDMGAIPKIEMKDGNILVYLGGEFYTARAGYYMLTPGGEKYVAPKEGYEPIGPYGFASFSPDGELLWEFKQKKERTEPCFKGNAIIFATTKALYAINQKTGELIAELKFGTGKLSLGGKALALAGGLPGIIIGAEVAKAKKQEIKIGDVLVAEETNKGFIIIGDRGVAYLDGETLQPVWTVPEIPRWKEDLKKGNVDYISSDNSYYFLTSKMLYSLRLSDGTFGWKIPLKERECRIDPANSRVYFYKGTKIETYSWK